MSTRSKTRAAAAAAAQAALPTTATISTPTPAPTPTPTTVATPKTKGKGRGRKASSQVQPLSVSVVEPPQASASASTQVSSAPAEVEQDPIVVQQPESPTKIQVDEDVVIQKSVGTGDGQVEVGVEVEVDAEDSKDSKPKEVIKPVVVVKPRTSPRTKASSSSTSTSTSTPTPTPTTKSTAAKEIAPTPTPTPVTATAKMDSSSNSKEVLCICDKGDDGTPMVFCGECNTWYHFECVNLNPEVAEDINVYVCPSCAEKTGRHTVMTWEGPLALEPTSGDEAPAVAGAPTAKTKTVLKKRGGGLGIGGAGKKTKATEGPHSQVIPFTESEESEDLDSEDEYVGDEVSVVKGKRRAQQPQHRLSSPDDSGTSSDDDDGGLTTAANRSSNRRHRITRKRQKTTTTTTSSVASVASGSVTGSPAPQIAGGSGSGSATLKRKAPGAVHGGHQQNHPPKKRRASEALAFSAGAGGDATDDPTRKYCLGKLEEIFGTIFLKYPHVRKGKGISSSSGPGTVSGSGSGLLLPTSSLGEEGHEQHQAELGMVEDVIMRHEDEDIFQGQQQPLQELNNADEMEIVEKKPEELTEEDKGQLMEASKRFAKDLEHCMYDIYSEPDKQGTSSAGSKYKDRFRMLQFNLSKPDRVVIHRRIASSDITPKEISTMDSTDLANEETKQSIKNLEKEALEYSILQKTIAPRAKLTHKGLQDIEDVNGDGRRERERDGERDGREQEEEGRRERERMARLKASTAANSTGGAGTSGSPPMQRQRTLSLSVPPESPSMPHHMPSSWGGPPPVPAHVLAAAANAQHQQQLTHGHGHGQGQGHGHEDDSNPLFIHTSSDFTMNEPELNLADLINIDDEPTGDVGAPLASASTDGGGGSGGHDGGGEVSGPGSGSGSGPPPVLSPLVTSPTAMDHHHHHVFNHHLHPPPPDSPMMLTDSPVVDTPSSVTGISPFATRTDPVQAQAQLQQQLQQQQQQSTSTTSFDLNALWAAPPTPSPAKTQDSLGDGQQGQQPDGSGVEGSTDQSVQEGVLETTSSPKAPPSPPLPNTERDDDDGGLKDILMDAESSLSKASAADDDFDMFLEKDDLDLDLDSGPRGTANELGGDEKEEEKDPEKVFEAIPKVWNGKIMMPLEPNSPKETTVVARQIAGRSLGHESPLWRTLFPSELVKIDGRVPVADSCKFLLQMSMNASKELLSVAFNPVPGDTGFKDLSDYLRGKGRHALVFPWGSKPKDYHPGRELYLIPLLASERLPDYMELLEDLRLPATRQQDYLIGIWILNKGRLAPLPHTPHPLSHHPPPPHTGFGVPPLPTVHVPGGPPQHPGIAGLSLPPEVAAQLNLAALNLPSLISQFQQPSTQHGPLTHQQQQQLGTPSPALAAELALLSPEQIQTAIRALTMAGVTVPGMTPVPPAGGPGPLGPGGPPPLLLPTGPHMQHHPPPLHPHAHAPPTGPHALTHPQPPPQPHPGWMNAPQGPPVPTGPAGYPHGPSSSQQYDRRGGDYGGRDRGRGWGGGGGGGGGGDRYGSGPSGPGPGWKGGRGGRGRGGGRGGRDGREHSPSRAPVDSGWPRRQRNDEGRSPTSSRRW
ncbi:hypothetical protein BDN72DRAFT_849198 [Pluteus cervinus]|uniref:Uncharacterized protein n=1 Tax=Pluteus cervinus TaxID=181527 RepID=A0ACD3A932_9AGAR|nr:hypothetical protein BDN72DRAFT_849198 [Pluteus cervinus]